METWRWTAVPTAPAAARLWPMCSAPPGAARRDGMRNGGKPVRAPAIAPGHLQRALYPPSGREAGVATPSH